jgi:hypothetical protein
VRGQFLEPNIVIVVESAFVVVDENRRGYMHRVAEAQSFIDAAPQKQVFDDGGDVDEAARAFDFEPEMLGQLFHPQQISQLSREGFGEIFGGGGDDFFFEFGVGDFLVEGFFVGGAVEGKGDGLIGPGGVEGGVGKFDGVNAFAAGNDEGSSVEDGFSEILHDGGVLGGGVFEWDVNVP